MNTDRFGRTKEQLSDRYVEKKEKKKGMSQAKYRIVTGSIGTAISVALVYLVLLVVAFFIG